MKALSFRQPWAHAVLHLGKRIENRQWSGCAYRGPILIHASKGTGTREDFYGEVEGLASIIGEAAWLRFRDEHLDIAHRRGMTNWLPRASLLRGGIVGRARIDGVILGPADMAAYDANHVESQRRWWAGGFALVLADVEPLPFVPWKGELGFFDVPESALAASRPAP